MVELVPVVQNCRVGSRIRPEHRDNIREGDLSENGDRLRCLSPTRVGEKASLLVPLPVQEAGVEKGSFLHLQDDDWPIQVSGDGKHERGGSILLSVPPPVAELLPVRQIDSCLLPFDRKALHLTEHPSRNTSYRVPAEEVHCRRS